MAGTGEVYKRKDGRWAFRLKAGNHEIVATDGGQGYKSRAAAIDTLYKIMTGEYSGDIYDVTEEPA